MKKLVSAFAAFTMMLALPTVAMAAQFNSPSGTTVTAPGTGVAISVSGDVSGNGFIHVDPSDVAASNVPEGVTPLASFEVVADDNVSFTELSLTFSVGSKYAGAKATVYIQHGDGTTDVQEATVAADGTVTIAVDRLSIFSIVVDESTIPADGGVATDTSATAPATDVNSAAVAGVTVAALAGAGVVAVTLRKKVSE
ncbi:hypothetical protein H6A23_05680 [Olsenella uli]|uniref:hypothetical protein n=1 Tax=Olsenella uli TaxID=133926 RepID=UPI0019563AAD|nr:hypothetical protein [Olsenella uli]MBM6816654.1 hypothetical protein [Olsenella uli]